MEASAKVISSNVLAHRNVNIPKNSSVTKSPLIFSNKLDGPQKSKINSFFSVSSKGKSDSTSPTSNCPSTVTAAPAKYDNKVTRANGNNATNLDVSLGFPGDDWDDFDDFETPVKSKNDSFTAEASGSSSKLACSPCKKKTEITNNDVTPELSNGFSNKNDISRSELSCLQTCDLEDVVNKPATFLGPSLNQDQVEFELEDSPIKMTRRRQPAHLKSVMSDSEVDDDVTPKQFEESLGNTLLVTPLVFICTFVKWTQCS